MPIPQLRSKKSAGWKDYKSSSPKRNSVRKSIKKKKLINRLISFGFISGLILFIFGSLYVIWVSRDLPNPNELINRQIAQSTKIYDRTGEHILYEISGDEKRTLVSLDEIPDIVKQATIAIEDKNFYEHGAFSVWAMFRTAVTNVIFRRSAGGSTLTQQFIKNAVLTSEKTITRKVKELVMAYRLEQKFSKDEILQMYLNEIPYGSNAYGVEAASQKYFGKSVKDVKLEEAAILAGIVQMPSRYSPYGPNKDILLGRKDYVLKLMAEQGYISEQERDEALKREVVFKAPGNNITAPHFVMYIKEILATKYGEKMIEQDGLKIYTTLDLYKQKIAEETISEKTKNYLEKYDANNAALVAIDPKTGQILAMVGSRDYFDDSIDGQVNVATRPRQPGSSMKPLVYAALFELGYNPNTILYDVLTNFSTDPASPYIPKNYNGKELGPVTIRQALAGSLNIPAVKAIYLADINNVIDLAENLGYTTLYPRNRFGLSLVLGGGEIKLLEHVNAYSAFARDGLVSPVISILKIEDKNGKIIEEYSPSSKKALSSRAARMINSVLSDNAARSYVFGENNSLNLGDRPVAAKTGTTNDYKDAWTVGYTPSLVAGVWVGNNSSKSMKGTADGSILAAPIWKEFMSKVLGDTPIENFKEPEEEKTNKDVLNGLLPTENDDSDVYHSILYYIDKEDPLGPSPSNPDKDPQFNLWENAIRDWAEKNGKTIIGGEGTGDIANRPMVKIDFPATNQIITSPNLEVHVLATTKTGEYQTNYYINGNLWETSSGEPGILFKEINFLNNGYHNLSVRVCDGKGNCGEDKISFNVSIKNNPVSTGKNSISLIGPANGSALTHIDFPLQLIIAIGDSQKTASINLITRDEISGKEELISKIITPSSTNQKIIWEKAPQPGQHSLYAELKSWNGETIKSNEIKITISD